MRNIVKKVSIMIILIMLLLTITGNAFALSEGDINNVAGGDPTLNVGGITGMGATLVTIVQVVGVVVAVVVILIIGIKYMIGSAEEKAEYKKTMIPYIIGAVLLFAGSILVNVIYSITQ